MNLYIRWRTRIAPSFLDPGLCFISVQYHQVIRFLRQYSTSRPRLIRIYPATFHLAYRVTALLTKLALTRENVDERLLAAQKQYKYAYAKHVRKTPVFRTNEQVAVDRPPLEVNTSNSKTTDKLTYRKFMVSADGCFSHSKSQTS